MGSTWIICRLLYSFSYYVNPELYLQAKSFDVILLVSIGFICIAFFAFWILHFQVKKLTITNQTEEMEKFAFKD